MSQSRNCPKKVIVHCILTVWYLDRLITLTSWKHPLIHKYNPTNKGYLKTHFPEYISIIWLVTFYLINKKLKLNNTNLNSYFPKSVFAQKKKKKIIWCWYKAYFSENIFQLQVIRKQSARIHQSLILCRLGDGTKKGI